MSLTLSRVWCNVLQVVCLADGYRVSGVLWNHAVWSILVAEVQTREWEMVRKRLKFSLAFWPVTLSSHAVRLYLSALVTGHDHVKIAGFGVSGAISGS